MGLEYRMNKYVVGAKYLQEVTFLNNDYHFSSSEQKMAFPLVGQKLTFESTVAINTYQ